MAMQFSMGNVDFELGTSTSPAPLKTADDPPFCIAILADFSGRGNRGLCETGPSLAARRRIPLDVDNFEGMPEKLGTEVRVPVSGKDGPRVAIQFGDLDDFQPDRIFDRLEVFQRLKVARKGLQDPTTFAEAASQVRSWVTGQPDTDQSEPAEAESSPAVSQESDADTIGRLLGKRPPAPPRQLVDIDTLIREAVKPYIVPAPHPQQAELVAQLDQAISGQMRVLLHHPDFQELEAAWRALQFLVSRVEMDETLKLYVFDVSKAELAADLASADDLQSSGTYRLLVEQSVGAPGAQPWTLLVGFYTFDQTEEDIKLLQRLAKVAQAARAPFLSAASPHFAGCESVAATPDPDDWRWQADPAAVGLWQQLRRSPEAASVGLALPRFLLRLPYGRDTEPVERFDFEELSYPPEHEQYLWGNPAVICACLLAEAFRESGWSLTGILQRDLWGLPMHVYKANGETQVTPCAEIFLTERAMENLVDKALIPLLSIKGRDAVRVARFQSIAEPCAPLSARWR